MYDTSLNNLIKGYPARKESRKAKGKPQGSHVRGSQSGVARALKVDSRANATLAGAKEHEFLVR